MKMAKWLEWPEICPSHVCFDFMAITRLPKDKKGPDNLIPPLLQERGAHKKITHKRRWGEVNTRRGEHTRR